MSLSSISCTHLRRCISGCMRKKQVGVFVEGWKSMVEARRDVF